MGCQEDFTYIVIDHDEKTLNSRERFITSDKSVYDQRIYEPYVPLYIIYMYISDEFHKQNLYLNYTQDIPLKVWSIGCAHMIVNILNNLFVKINKSDNFYFNKITMNKIFGKFQISIRDISENLIQKILDYLGNKSDININNININNIDAIKNKYDELINNHKIIDSYNDINSNEFNEQNLDDVNLSNTIIKFLIKILLDCLHLDIKKVPNNDILKMYIIKIDFLLNKIKMLCELVEQYKIKYHDLLSYELTYPKSLDEFISK